MLEIEPALVPSVSVARMQFTDVNKRAILRVQSWAPVDAPVQLPGLLGARGRSVHSDAIDLGEARALCVGPADWLLVSATLSAESLRRQVGFEASGNEFSVVDLTHGLAVIEARGDAIRDVLSKGCALDLHPDRFRAGQSHRTRFAKIAAVLDFPLDCPGERPSFELYIASSYQSYLHAWLRDAAAEFEGGLQ